MLTKVLLLVVLVALFVARVTIAVPLQWTRLTVASGSVPSERMGSGMAYDPTRDVVWMFGGKPTDNTDLLWSFDLSSGAWTEHTPSGGDGEPETRFSMVAGWDSVNDRLVVGTGEGAGKTFYYDAWSYSPNQNQWTRFADPSDVPELRYGASGGIYNGDNFVATHGFRDDRYNDMHMRDLSAGTSAANPWVELVAQSDVPSQRCVQAGTIIDDKMAMYGGCGSKGYGPCPSEEAWVYDFDDSTWTQVDQCMPPRMMVTMTPFEDDKGSTARRIVTFGGTGKIFGSGGAGEVGILDLDSLQWRRFAPQTGGDMPAPQTMPNMQHVPATHADIPGHSELDGISFVLVTTKSAGNTITWALYGDPDHADSGETDCASVFNIRAFHGALMFLSWGLLIPIGMFIAHYLRKYKWWFPAHKACMLSGLFLAFGGLITAILMVPVHPLSIGHHQLGAAIMLLGLQQPINAILRPHVTPKTRKRIYWEYLHKGVGRLLGFLGVLNCFLGFLLIKAHVAIIVLYGILMAFFMVANFFIPVTQAAILLYKGGAKEEKQDNMLPDANADATKDQDLDLTELN